MKKEAFSFFIFLFLFLYPAFANEIEYAVKFKEDFKVTEELNEYFHPVKAEKGLYTTKSIEKISEYGKYIERFYKNENVLELGMEGLEEFTVPIDPEMGNQTYLSLINVDRSYEIESYGNEVIVGVIDSGCFLHSDLKDNLLPGKNYIEDNDDTTDTYGHGTHVSGIIAAAINDIGVVGVSPKAKIVPLKCFDAKNGNPLNVIDAIYDAVDKFNCRIINLSFGVSESDIQESIKNGQLWSVDFKEAIDYAIKKGVIVIAAVGNDKSSELNYPAAFDGVIGVGSVDFDKKHSSFSQYNSSVMVVAPAPAGKVLSTCIVKDSTSLLGFKEAYKKTGGTSQAAPQVAAMAAIALSVNPSLTSKDFEELLKATSEDLGDEGRDDYYGYGLINIGKMIEKQLESINIYVSPVNINKGKAKVYIKNNSSENLIGESIFSEYEENKFLSHLKSSVELKAGESDKYYFDFSGNKVNHFLWKSISDIFPYVKEREVNINEKI